MSYKNKIATRALIISLAFGSKSLGENINYYSISENYNIKIEQVIPEISKDTFTIYVDNNPLNIQTKDFLQKLLDINIVKVFGEKEYKRLAKEELDFRVIGGSRPSERSFDGIKKGYYSSDGSDRDISWIYGMISGSAILYFTFTEEGTVLIGKMEGSIFPTVINDDEAVLELTDMVFPKRIREKRNLGEDILIDKAEANIMNKLVLEVLKRYFIK